MSSWFPVTTTAALLSTPLVVIIFIVGHMAVTAPSVPCPTGCDCSVDKSGLLTAKCSLSSFAVDSAEDFFSIQLLSFNNSDSAGPVSLKDDMFQAFSGVTVIQLSNCSVGYIHPAAFRGLKFLQELDLSNNLITHFHRTSFNSTPKLFYLSLNNNPIEITDLFLSSRSLQELRLESCSIQHIPSGAFKALPKLKSLSLYNNNLETIPPHTIPMTLKRLNVAKNRLVNIPTEVIYSLKRIRVLDISENLINCSCRLMGLQDWLSGRGVTFENDVLCASPPKYHGKSWNTVNEDEVCNKEIKMAKEFNNNVYGESTSADIDCDDMKASCDELGETLQADQPLMKQDTEKNSENELPPNDEPAGTENSEGSAATDEPEGKDTSAKETNNKESEGDGEEKTTEEEVKTAPETSQDETAAEEDENEKTVEESTEQLAAKPEEVVNSEEEPAAEEDTINGTEEKLEDTPKKESGESLTVSEVNTAEDSAPSSDDQVAESGAAEASETPSSIGDTTLVEVTSVSSRENADVEESVAVTSDRAAEGRSLDISATDSPGKEDQGSSTNVPEAIEEVSAVSSEAPVESIVESSTEARIEPNEVSEGQNTASSTTEVSEPASVTVQDLGLSPETSSSEASTEAVTVENIPDTGYESSSENPASSSSAAPEEVSTTPLPDLGLDASSVSSSIAPETTSSSPELSSSVSPENVDVSTTPETNIDATAVYFSSSEIPSSSEAPISSSEAPISSSEAPISSSEAPISSSTTESDPVVEIGLDGSSSELPSSPSTSESPVPVESGVSSEAPSSTVDSLSTSIPLLAGVNVEDNGSNLTAGVLPDQTQEPIISYDKVMTELKSNPGAYVLGCIVLLLAVLLLIALSRCRKAPPKKRREEKYDSDMNGGTELQEITSLIPASMSNGTKIYNNKYPSEKPSKDTMNLLSTEKDSNGVVIPLHGDPNGTASNNNTPWSNGTKANAKGCNGTGKTDGSVVSVTDRGSQFFDDGVNPPIELTKVKVMMLPDSVPKTPVFVHRNPSDDNS